MNEICRSCSDVMFWDSVNDSHISKLLRC